MKRRPSLTRSVPKEFSGPAESGKRYLFLFLLALLAMWLSFVFTSQQEGIASWWLYRSLSGGGLIVAVAALAMSKSWSRTDSDWPAFYLKYGLLPLLPGLALTLVAVFAPPRDASQTGGRLSKIAVIVEQSAVVLFEYDSIGTRTGQNLFAQNAIAHAVRQMLQELDQSLTDSRRLPRNLREIWSLLFDWTFQKRDMHAIDLSQAIPLVVFDQVRMTPLKEEHSLEKRLNDHWQSLRSSDVREPGFPSELAEWIRGQPDTLVILIATGDLGSPQEINDWQSSDLGLNPKLRCVLLPSLRRSGWDQRSSRSKSEVCRIHQGKNGTERWPLLWLTSGKADLKAQESIEPLFPELRDLDPSEYDFDRDAECRQLFGFNQIPLVNRKLLNFREFVKAAFETPSPESNSGRVMAVAGIWLVVLLGTCCSKGRRLAQRTLCLGSTLKQPTIWRALECVLWAAVGLGLCALCIVWPWVSWHWQPEWPPALAFWSCEVALLLLWGLPFGELLSYQQRAGELKLRMDRRQVRERASFNSPQAVRDRGAGWLAVAGLAILLAIPPLVGIQFPRTNGAWVASAVPGMFFLGRLFHGFWRLVRARSTSSERVRSNRYPVKRSRDFGVSRGRQMISGSSSRQSSKRSWSTRYMVYSRKWLDWPQRPVVWTVIAASWSLGCGLLLIPWIPPQQDSGMTELAPLSGVTVVMTLCLFVVWPEQGRPNLSKQRFVKRI